MNCAMPSNLFDIYLSVFFSSSHDYLPPNVYARFLLASYNSLIHLAAFLHTTDESNAACRAWRRWCSDQVQLLQTHTHRPARPPGARPKVGEAKARARPAPNRPWWHPWPPTRLAHTQTKKQRTKTHSLRTLSRTHAKRTHNTRARAHTHTPAQSRAAPGRARQRRAGPKNRLSGFFSAARRRGCVGVARHRSGSSLRRALSSGRGFDSTGRRPAGHARAGRRG